MEHINRLMNALYHKNNGRVPVTGLAKFYKYNEEKKYDKP